LPLHIDLHVHSSASSDGVSSIVEIIEAARIKGLDGVAITDHDVIMEVESACKITRETGFLILPGIEVTTNEGHVLVLNPHRTFKKGLPFMDVLSSALSDGSAVIIAHPTDPVSHGVGPELVEKASYLKVPLEVLNSSTMRCFNNSARILAERLSMPMCGGSDAHLAEAVGDAFTLIETEGKSLPEVIEAIINGKTTPYGSQTKKSLAAKTVFGRLCKKMR
jgi:predicted metal-dependent phosphoesterase TrpH